MKIPDSNPYLKFIQNHFPGIYELNWHNIAMSYYVDQWVEGKIKYLIFEIPPQYGKTTIGSTMLAPYVFSKFPTARFAYTTHTYPLAKRYSRVSKSIMRSEKYKEENGELTVPPGFRTFDYWENTLGGIYGAFGRDGGLNGTPQDFLICDDLFKHYDEAMSPVIRDSVWYWFVTVALKRLSPQGRIMLFFTRWNADDVIGRCLKLMEDDNQYSRPWIIVRFPGLMTDKNFASRHPADPRQPGEALWPWKETVDDLEMARLEMGDAAFNAVYQQHPVNEHGTKINPDWFQTIGDQDIPSGLRWHRYWRLGELEKNTKDKNNATCLLAKSQDGKYFVTDMEYFVDDWPGCLDKIKNTGKSERRVRAGFKQPFRKKTKNAGGAKKDLFAQVEQCKRQVKILKGVPPVDPLVWTPDAKDKKIYLKNSENASTFLESCRNYTGTGADNRAAEIEALAGAYKMIGDRRSIVNIMAAKNRKLKNRRMRHAI